MAMNKSLYLNRSFISVWLGNGVSELGGAFGTFCNSILIYQLTGSTLALSSMWLLYFGPSLILQLFIGPFIDRWSRKWTMMIAQWSRGLVFIVPLVAAFTDTLVPWHIYVVQIAVGLITPFYVPANQAITPTIVPKEQLEQANAMIEGTVRLMTFTAPLLGGIVIEYIGILPTLMMVCGLLIVSGLTLLPIQEKRAHWTVRTSWGAEFTSGLITFFSNKLLVWLGIFLAFVQFGVGVTMVTTLPYITEELGGSYASYGYFMAGFPVGYILGTLLIGYLPAARRRTIMLGALFVGGCTFIALFFNQKVPLGIVTEVVGGIAMAIFSVHNITIVQRIVPNELMGKVTSVRLFIMRAAMPLGIIVSGYASSVWGVRPLYMLIGSIICTVSLLGMVLPYFSFMDEDVAECAQDDQGK